jgi:hypothetical protein
MKKLTILGLALLVMGFAGSALAADLAYVNIFVTVSDVTTPSIERTSSDAVTQNLGFGVASVIPDGSKTVLRNNGNGVATWSCDVDATPLTVYTLRTTTGALANNEIRFSGIVHYNVAGTTPANFGADDILTATRQNCSASAFADAGDPTSNNGTGVAMGDVRDFRILIETPPTGSTPASTQVAPRVYATTI